MTVKSIPLFPSAPTKRGQVAPEPDKIKAEALREAFQAKQAKVAPDGTVVPDGKIIFLRGDHGVGQSLDGAYRDATLTTTQPKGVKYRELAEMASDAKREIRAILIASSRDEVPGRPVVSPGQHLIAHEGGGFTRVHPSAPEQSPGQQRIAGIFDRVTAGKPGITRGDLDKIMLEIGFKPLPVPVRKQVQASLQDAVSDAAVVQKTKGVVTEGKHAAGDLAASAKNLGVAVGRAIGLPIKNEHHYRAGSGVPAQSFLSAQAYQEGDASPPTAADKTLTNRAALMLAPNAVAVYSSISKFTAVKAVLVQIEASNLPGQVQQELKEMCQSLQHGFAREAGFQGVAGSLKQMASLAIKFAGDPGLFDGVAEVLSSPAEAFVEFANEKLASMANPDIGDAWSLSDDLVDKAGTKAAEKSGQKAADKSLDLGGRKLVDQEPSDEPVPDAKMAANQSGLRKREMKQHEWAGALERFCSDVPDAGLDARQQAEVRQFAEEIVACVHKKFSAQSALVKMAASNPAVAAEEIFARQQGVAQADELAKAEKKLGKALGLMEQ